MPPPPPPPPPPPSPAPPRPPPPPPLRHMRENVTGEISRVDGENWPYTHIGIIVALCI